MMINWTYRSVFQEPERKNRENGKKNQKRSEHTS